MFDENTQPIDTTSTEQAVEGSTQTQEAAVESPKEHLKEYNLRTMRERAEAAERRAKDLENQIKQARESYSQQEQRPQRQSPVVDDIEELNVGDEELIEGKHLKKYVNSITKKYDRELQQIKSQTTIDAAERTLRSRYPDADDVLSEDNVNNFKALYPEEFSSVMSNPDAYARMKSAYTNIVNFGIAERRQPTRDIDRRLEENKTKPKSVAGATHVSADSPLSRVSEFERRILTPEMKERNLQKLARAKEEAKYNRG